MKKPFLYAFSAASYIVIIVLVISSLSQLVPKDTILTPMVVLGLFVLSAALMGFLFLYEPFNLYMENRKQEAVDFFGKIVAFFACFVALFVILVFLGIF